MTFFEDRSLAWPSIKSTEDHAALSEQDVAAMVATWSPLLFRVAFAMLRSHAEAEDIVQETFLRVLKHEAALPLVRDLRPWLVRIAWNLALDRHRQRRPDQLDDVYAASLAAATVASDTAAATSQRMRVVLAEMERLPAAERQVLLLSAIEELETAEMAVVLKRSESAVRALLARARARLRRRLGQTSARPRKEKP